MIIQVLTLIAILILSTIYLFFFSRVQVRFFNSFNTNRNTAINILYAGSLIGASVNMVVVADVSVDSIRYFLYNDDFLKAFYFSVFFYIGMWLFSLIVFHATFFLVSILTKENEKVELNKNNLEIAITHTIIIIGISFVIAPLLSSLASGLIPHPEIPF